MFSRNLQGLPSLRAGDFWMERFEGQAVARMLSHFQISHHHWKDTSTTILMVTKDYDLPFKRCHKLYSQNMDEIHLVLSTPYGADISIIFPFYEEIETPHVCRSVAWFLRKLINITIKKPFEFHDCLLFYFTFYFNTMNTGLKP